MWAASESSASDCAMIPATTSPAMKATIRPRAIASLRESASAEIACECE